MLSLLLSSPVFAAVLHVDPDDNTGSSYTSVDAAIEAAAVNDTILLAPGEYGELVVDKPLEIRGEFAQTTRVQRIQVEGARVVIAQVSVLDARYAIDVRAAQVDLEGVRVVGGGDISDGYGLRARDHSQVTITEGIFQGIRASYGAIRVESGSSLTIDQAVISDCEVATGGAIRVHSGSATLENVLLQDNRSAEQGGALSVLHGNVELRQTWIQGNRARQGGGLFVGEASVLTVSDVMMLENTAEAGGQIYVDGGGISLVRSVLQRGQADYGAAAFVSRGELIATNALWTDHEATQGGALFVGAGRADLSFAVIADNTAGLGGAAAVESGELVLRSSIIAGNRAEEGIANASAEPVGIYSCLFWDNGADDWLGAVQVVGRAIEGSPRFVDHEGGDYALALTSPALDALDGTDLDGTPADLGMYGGSQAWPLADNDGDGYAYGRDCDDAETGINEGAAEVWYDGVDADCSGKSDYDADGDGFLAVNVAGIGGDCDDEDPAVHPGAPDEADGLDQDCDGGDLTDRDGDGWASPEDCDEANPGAYPGAKEVWYDGIDSDCYGGDDFDADLDGAQSDAYGGQDCDDRAPSVAPGAPEVAGDGVDQDCDGLDAEDGELDAGGFVDEVLSGEWFGGEEEEPAAAPSEPLESQMVQTGCSYGSGIGRSAGVLAALSALLLSRRRRK